MSGIPQHHYRNPPGSSSPVVMQAGDSSSPNLSASGAPQTIPSSSFNPATVNQSSNMLQSPHIHGTGSSFTVRWPPNSSPAHPSLTTTPRPIGRPPTFTGSSSYSGISYSSATPSFRGRGRGRGRPPLNSYIGSPRLGAMTSPTPNVPLSSTPQSFQHSPLVSHETPMSSVKTTEFTAMMSNSGSRDVSRMDLESLQDVTTYADIDLKEESEQILRELPGVGADQFDFAYDLIEGRRDAFLYLKRLKRKLQDISLGFGIDSIQEEILDCLTLATQEYLRSVLEELILVSKHREEVIFDKLCVTVTNDPKKQLWLLDRQEKELKRRESEFKPQEDEVSKPEEEIEERDVAAASDKGASLSATQLKKRRKERDDAVSKAQAANVAALAALGVAKKSWMTIDMNQFTQQKSSPTAAPEKKLLKPTGAPTTLQLKSSTTVNVDSRRISMKDLLFYMERDIHSRKSRQIYESYLRLK